MQNKKKILAISGSTRSNSSNLNLIKYLAELSKDDLDITIFDGLTSLPHFNPDLDIENAQAPKEVIDFRNLLRASHGVIICTPEYAMGVPGSLKNAIDWTVSSCEFSHKPTALITAASLGKKGHASLLETLKVIECDIPERIQLLIPHIKTKITAEGKIVHSETSEKLKTLLNHFIALLDR